MNEYYGDISKSQRKRDAEDLQKLGQKIAELNLTQINQLNLPESLLEAILSAKTIKSHGAKKRQLQFIGRMMRNIEDIELLQKSYENMVQGSTVNAATFHLIEQWRDRLLSTEPKIIEEFLLEYPKSDKKELTRLIAKAQNERTYKNNQGSAKALFRLIKSIVS